MHAPDEKQTLRETPPAEAQVRLDATTLEDAAHATRYHVGEMLGEGGMGEVRRCRDRRVGRDVAMKVVRAEAAGAAFIRERFLREARVQGQLEHPCVVPVYDIGLGEDGATYFTMKRVRGETLEGIVEGLRDGDPAALLKWSRRRLLAAFSTVCGAIEYAHTRGVLHRDLKPSNVMLGDFGEVYVLDWGVARVLHGPTSEEAVHAPMPERGRTAEGAIIGTPGYMSPEQLRGEADLDGRADVYSLGAILFEVLALEPLHPGESVEALLSTTMLGVDARPSARSAERDFAPELEEACVRATRVDRGARFATAGELRAAVDRFLDGDRDVERRRDLAAGHAAEAERAAERTLSGDELRRPEALREVGKALALDPGNSRALRAFVGLLVSPPRDEPTEVTERLHAEADEIFRAGARGGMRSYLAWMVTLLGVFALGVRDLSLLAAIGAMVLACAAVSHAISRAVHPAAWMQFTLMGLNLVAVGMLSRLFGPFVLAPCAVVSVTLAFSMTPYPHRRALFGVMGAIGMIVPALLDVSGLVAPSYVLQEGSITLVAQMVDLSPTRTFAAILLGQIATLFVALRLFKRIRDSLEAAARRQHLLSWQLRQIVPSDGAQPTHAKQSPSLLDRVLC